MTTGHNHPPTCCCPPLDGSTVYVLTCPQCPEHGELAQLSGPPDCSSCHAHHGQPHTEYCHAGGIVGADPREQTGADADRATREHYRS